MKKSAIFLLGLAMSMLAGSPPRADEIPPFLIITHPDNPATSLTRTQVSKILLKQASRWADGSVAEPVDQIGQTGVREVFTKEIHGRSVSSIKSYWQRQIFSGRGVPPPELENDEQVVEFVRNRPGAIGYISGGSVPRGVRKLDVTE